MREIWAKGDESIHPGERALLAVAQDPWIQLTALSVDHQLNVIFKNPEGGGFRQLQGNEQMRVRDLTQPNQMAAQPPASGCPVAGLQYPH